MGQIVAKGSLLLLFSISVLIAKSQDTTSNRIWRNGGAFNINISQVGIKNWVGGGQNSLSITALPSLFINLDKPKVKWSNQIDIGFGLLRQGRDNNFYK